MLKGKTALVTGSTSGIGLGIATRLAAEGANIVLNGFGERAEIERISAELKTKSRVTVTYDAADMTKPAAIAAMLASAIGQFGAVDVLVNNAGIQHVAPVDEFPLDKWDAIIAINLSSAFHTVRAALPAMKARRWGRIVNIASAHALVASPFKSAYVSAKHGIAGFTKTVALEVASANELLRLATAEVFESWIGVGTRRFAAAGVPKGTAREVAIVLITSLEGAFILSRAMRDTEPVRIAGATTVAALREALADAL